MHFPVEAVVFVSHRLKRAVFRVCRVLWKNTCRKGDFFAKLEKA